MQEYVVKRKSLVAHHGSTDLAHSDTVPPPCSMQNEAHGNTIANVLLIDNKSRAIEMRF